VVPSVTALSYTTEGKVRVQHLDYCIVDYEGAWRSVVFYVIDIVGVLAEDVYYQRFGTVSDLIDEVLKIGIGVEGEDGPEDLLFHEQAVFARFFNDSGGKVEFVFYNFATVEKWASMVLLKQSLQLFEMV
jgi:hypothetical protein